MPISVDRHTGEIISKPEITQQQKDKAWEYIVQNWVTNHQGEFRKLILGHGGEEK